MERPRLDPALFSRSDGFSRPTKIWCHLPGGVNVETLRLERFGVQRENLVLTLDFVSQRGLPLTHRMLAMGDQAFAWLAPVAEPCDPLCADRRARSRLAGRRDPALWLGWAGRS
ncbi:MAG TPA: hypothetical protein DEP35_17500 [Deltaproteobacteria bacterium]|nr:hypothetical protein [Deltaproteobacteria bacterium]